MTESDDRAAVAARGGFERRNVLLLGAAGVAGLTLAACSGSSGSGSSASAIPTSSSPTPTGPASSNGPAAGKPITAVSDVPVGGATLAKAQGTTFLVAQPKVGEIVCHSGICTHQGCPLGSVAGQEAICPCHGSRFDAFTGAVINGPATRPLPAITVNVEDGEVTN